MYLFIYYWVIGLLGYWVIGLLGYYCVSMDTPTEPRAETRILSRMEHPTRFHRQ